MFFVKQSTAVTIVMGPFVDEDDGKTAEAGLAIAQADYRLSKNGGNMAQKNDANAGVHDEIGYYTTELDATDTNTLGTLRVMVHESGALPVWEDFMVLPANVYDSLVSGSDALQVHTNEITANLITAAAINNGAIDAATFAAGAIDAAAIANGAIDAATFAAGAIDAAAIANAAIDAATFAAGAIDAAAIAADAIGASELAATAVAEIADGVWDEAIAGHAGAGTFGQQCGTDIDAILVDTADLQGNGVDVTAISGDAAAANNLEAMLDGTGGVTLTTALTGAITGNITGNLSGSVGSVTGNVGGNVGGNVTGSVGSVVGAVGSVTGNVGGNVVGTVASVVGAVGSVTGNVGGNVTGSVGSVVAGVDATQINSSAAAAQDLAASAATIVQGTVDNAAFVPTNTQWESDDVTEATASHYNGRIVIFTSGALTDQATDITAYALVGGRGFFTVTAMTEAPANNDTFVIV